MKRFLHRVLPFLALLVCAGYLVHSSRAGALTPEGQGKEDAETSAQQAERTKALFNERCAKCHGRDGRGDTVLGKMVRAPDFTDETWWKEEKHDKRFIDSVTNGKDDMPAFGKKLSRHEISTLVTYLRRRFHKATR